MKKAISVTIDETLLNEFDEILEETMVCRSTMINYLIRQEMAKIQKREIVGLTKIEEFNI